MTRDDPGLSVTAASCYPISDQYRRERQVMARETVRGFASRREAPGLAFDLVDLARNLIEDLFDTYRPELHYMRGPGPKWRDKHERTLRLAPDRATVPSLPSLARQSIGWHNLIKGGAFLMLGIGLFVTASLFISPTASKADVSNCAQASDLAAARLRWAAARQSRGNAAQDEKQCQVYGIHFYDAVTARQAASICEDDIHRQRDLDLLDFEIDAFNNLIAAQCGG